jgi:hypothetical protein
VKKIVMEIYLLHTYEMKQRKAYNVPGNIKTNPQRKHVKKAQV